MSGPDERIPRPETEFSRQARFVWAGRIGGAVLRLWGRTWRIRKEEPAAVAEFVRTGQPYIHGFFHEHILSLSYAYRKRGVVVLVSQSADGEYISQVIHRLGYGTVRGSTTRGGLRALLTMAKIGAGGRALSVTPDGPRGPRREVQLGILHIASRSGQPIVPLGVAISSLRRLGGWDRFEIPLPFAKIQIVAGEPIPIAADLSPDELEKRYLALLQERFAYVEERAQRLLFGEPKSDATASDATASDATTSDSSRGRSDEATRDIGGRAE
ncbi:MAG: lysophospholipid acyltransferase family protein [Candidatus Eisenbacteria bacterium]|uniref:Lysophospholipid acyltransferase family protein n=1 Tax=Eiseniibacteriota bacterium TaxID=2212470 RepID=A0A956NC16_UNCEI|nr:lysophospholipid acyltransferase family protein [Candidatus Eisenbacteria bacterium]MCB9462814.1 lysophospholipid acyltransferase family protein [Candidatus Eisenbacteria bacterium]